MEDLFAVEVLAYWQAKSGRQVRLPSVRASILARITKRLSEGFTPADLKRCVDFATFDEFYTSRGYAKDPTVIWRNRERVESILSRCAHAASRPLPL